MAIVTISRECGSGGEEIGKAVARKLNYEYYNKAAIYRDIEKHGEQWLEMGGRAGRARPVHLGAVRPVVRRLRLPGGALPL